jgi:hypothetical protein
MSRSIAPVCCHSSRCRRNRIAALLGKYWYSADADAGAFGHPRGGEPGGAFVLQNLSSGFENGRDQVVRS